MALPKIVQGATYHGLEITWTVDGAGLDLTGATLTGAIRNRAGQVREITGELAPDPDQETNPGLFTWIFSEEDTEDISPAQVVQFYADFGGGQVAKTYLENLTIEDDISS